MESADPARTVLHDHRNSVKQAATLTNRSLNTNRFPVGYVVHLQGGRKSLLYALCSARMEAIWNSSYLNVSQILFVKNIQHEAR